VNGAAAAWSHRWVIAVVALASLVVAATGVVTAARWGDRDEPTGRCGRSSLGERTGIAPGGWWLHEPATAQAADLDRAVAMGVGWLRLGVDWAGVEPRQGERHWDRLLEVARMARARCLSVLAVVSYTPAWARATPCASSQFCRPASPATFARFVGEAVRRLGPTGVRSWEVWNEPNAPSFFLPEPDPVAYAAILRAAALAVHDEDPGALVVSGGLAPAGRSGRGPMEPVAFLASVQAHGGLYGVDAVGLHPYSYPAPPTRAGTAFSRTLPALRARVAPLPVWLTEFGAPTGTAPGAVSETDQAAALRAGVLAAAARARVGPLFVYSIRDAGTDAGDRESNFGVYRHDGRPKVAVTVLESVLRR
jgi:hypothetical protein